MLKVWLFGRARFQVRLLDKAGVFVKLLADDCSIVDAFDVVVRWRAKNRAWAVPVHLQVRPGQMRCDGYKQRAMRRRAAGSRSPD